MRLLEDATPDDSPRLLDRDSLSDHVDALFRAA